ncbi:MAG TPA: hypothetical protein VGL33_19540 [Streptosporangiaceae bacterium]
MAISSKASAAQKAVAEAFFKEVLASSSYAKATVGAGEVPVIKGATGLFARQQLASYDQTIYSSVEKAPSFQYSWDQAVAPQQATPMLANLAQVFELSMTPQKFAATMDSQPAGA